MIFIIIIIVLLLTICFNNNIITEFYKNNNIYETEYDKIYINNTQKNKPLNTPLNKFIEINNPPVINKSIDIKLKDQKYNSYYLFYPFSLLFNPFINNSWNYNWYSNNILKNKSNIIYTNKIHK
jgi:hypothetical protein